MDLFRLEDGKVVEHWDTIQEVLKTAANANTMFSAAANTNASSTAIPNVTLRRRSE